MASNRVEQTLQRLSKASHRGGAFGSDVLIAISKTLPDGDLVTLETGCGKSTIMFSQIATRHVVFAYDDRGSENSSVSMVQNDTDFESEKVEFVFGPTQQTLLKHDFSGCPAFDVMLIDGPHGYPFPDLEYALLYPRLKAGGILIIDDVHIPSIGRMYDILREDRMYDEIGVVATTGLLRRTVTEGVPADGDHWYEQQYNYVRFPLKMDKYEQTILVTNGDTIDFSDSKNRQNYLSRGFAVANEDSAVTTDVTAMMQFDLGRQYSGPLLVEIQYKCRNPQQCAGSKISIGRQSFELPVPTAFISQQFKFDVDTSGKIDVHFGLPNVKPEHDLNRKRFDFCRYGLEIRSISIEMNAFRYRKLGKLRKIFEVLRIR